MAQQLPSLDTLFSADPAVREVEEAFMRRLLAVEEVEDLEERVTQTLALHQHPFFQALADDYEAKNGLESDFGPFPGPGASDDAEPY